MIISLLRDFLIKPHSKRFLVGEGKNRIVTNRLGEVI